MNTYKIISAHTVTEDSYELGELEQTNYFEVIDEVKAEAPQAAIEWFFENVLYFELSHVNVSDDNEGLEENEASYSFCVNSENWQASKAEIEAWKEGEIKLYSDNVVITVFEVVPAKI